MKKKIVQKKSYKNPYDYEQCKAWQARSQKFAIEGVVFGGLGGLRAKPPAARGTGVSGRSPQHLKILHFFQK